MQKQHADHPLHLHSPISLCYSLAGKGDSQFYNLQLFLDKLLLSLNNILDVQSIYFHLYVCPGNLCSFDPSAFCPAQGKSFFIKVVLEFIYEDH